MDAATMEQLIRVAILGLAVPAVVAGIKAVIPRIPSHVIPYIAIIGPAVIDSVALLVADVSATGHPVWTLIGGAVGVGIREIWDQTAQALGIKKPDDGSPDAPAQGGAGTTLSALLLAATLAALLAGCVTPPERVLPPPPENATPAEHALAAAREAIAQGYVAVLRAQALLDAEVQAGVLPKAWLEEGYQKIESARRLLEEGRKALKLGDVALAKASADGADGIEAWVEQYLAKRIAERRGRT